MSECVDPFGVGTGGAEPEDAGDRGDDDAVSALDQVAGGGQAELIEVIVFGGVFFDVDVAAWDVGLGLVVVVIGNEVVDGVVWEERFELFVELGGEGFVVREDEGGFVCLGDDIGHRESLAGAGGSEQARAFFTAVDRRDEGVDRVRLIAGGLEIADHFEWCLLRNHRRIIGLFNRDPCVVFSHRRKCRAESTRGLGRIFGRGFFNDFNRCILDGLFVDLAVFADLIEADFDSFGDASFLHGDAEEFVGGLHGAFVVGDDDEAALLGEDVQRGAEAADIGLVEGGVNFVEDTKAAWFTAEDCKKHGDGGHGFFAA